MLDETGIAALGYDKEIDRWASFTSIGKGE